MSARGYALHSYAPNFIFLVLCSFLILLKFLPVGGWADRRFTPDVVRHGSISHCADKSECLTHIMMDQECFSSSSYDFLYLFKFRAKIDAHIYLSNGI